MAGALVGWVRRHDPEFDALRKAVKAAIAVTAGVAIGTASGNGQITLFAAFGGVAFLLFADFPGNRSARLGGYLGLFVVGGVLICLGTLMSRTAWLAVLGMAVFGFVILFSGLLSAAVAAASRAALLSFILPVTVPGTAAEMVSRVAGWTVAALIAIPLAVLIWPPADHHKLRRRGAEACAALATLLEARTNRDVERAPAADGAARDGIVALRKQFRSTTFRPVGLTSGSRVLMQLTDRLEWLYSVARRIPMTSGDRWPAHTLELVTSCAGALRAASDVLASGTRPTYASRQALSHALREMERHRARVSVFLDVVAEGAGSGPPPDPQDEPSLRPAVAHELAYTSLLAASTVAVSAAADARPLMDRLLGRHLPGTLEGPVAAAHRIAAGHITRRSVWFQNSLRGAVGLALAVYLAEVTEIQHGFWVVLGAMSVLRTTALTTGSTALRAFIGTLVGFFVGAGIMIGVGSTPWHLWLLLPLSVMVAGYLPEAVSFIAGQAAFTVMVVVLFNIIQPVGWSVGLVRIEDIALGCLAGIVSGFLLWPRGAAAQIRAAMSDHYRHSADALQAAVQRVADPLLVDADVLRDAIDEARSAGLRLDDAFRQYLFERGTKTVPVIRLTTLSNGAIRVRLAAEAIAEATSPLARTPFILPSVDPGGAQSGTQAASALDGAPDHRVTDRADREAVGGTHEAAAEATPEAATEAGTDSVTPRGDPDSTTGTTLTGTTPIGTTPIGTTLTTAGTAILDCATHSAEWYRSVADRLSRTRSDLPTVGTAQAEQELLGTLHANAHLSDRPSVAARARTLWAASLYIDDVTRLEARVRDDLTAIDAARAAGPFRRGSPEPEPSALDRTTVGSAAGQ